MMLSTHYQEILLLQDYNVFIENMNNKSIISYLGKSFITNVSRVCVTLGINLLLIPIIIKDIGLKNYGLLSITFLFSSVSSFVDLGLSKALIVIIGKKKITRNRAYTSSLIINIIVIVLLIIIFFCLYFLDVNFLGKEFNEDNNDLIVFISFFMLIITLINNFQRSYLEASYLLHWVNIIQVLQTFSLYFFVYIFIKITSNQNYILIVPIIISILFVIIYFIISKYKTNIKLESIKLIHLKYMISSSTKFLNVGIVNSMVLPSIKYLYIYNSGNAVGYGIMDILLKIAITSNTLIASTSTPLFSLFATNTIKSNLKKITQNIFYVNAFLFIIGTTLFYFIGYSFLEYLLKQEISSNLFKVTLTLLIGVCSVGVVEPYYRFFLGKQYFKKAFTIKLTIPIIATSYFFFSKNITYENYLYAYSIGVIASSIVTIIFYKKIK